MNDKWAVKLLAKVKKLESQFESWELKNATVGLDAALSVGVEAPSEFVRLRHRSRTLLSQRGIPQHYLDGYLWSESVPAATFGKTARGVLRALVEDLEEENIPPIGTAIRAETLSEMLDLAESLLDAGNPLPGAAVAGAVLEGHLRGLCEEAGVEVNVGKKGGSLGKYADALRAEGLLRKDVYRLVSGWITLRNDASHMKAENLGEPPVRAMITGLRSLMAFGSQT